MGFNRTKLIALAIAVIAVAAIAGCASQASEKKPGATLEVDGKEVEVPYVMKIDGQEVSLDEYSYYFFSSKYYYDYGDETFWNGKDSDEQEELLKAEVLDSIKESYLIKELACADGYVASQKDLEFIEKNINSQISTLGGKTAYEQTLVKKHLTDAVYRAQWQLSLYYDYLYSHYFDKGGIYYNAASDPDSEQVKESNYAKLEEILSQRAENMTVEFGSQYGMITVKTLS